MKTLSIYAVLFTLFSAIISSCSFDPFTHGYVYDAATSEPVPGVVVTIGGLTDTTSFDGYFNLGTLPSGQYEIDAVRVCYDDYHQMLDLNDEIHQLAINLFREKYSVSRIYDIEWLNASTLNEVRNNPKNWIEWPEVIELNNDIFEFSGRVKLGKNGWLPIVPEWLENLILYNVFYPIPILVPKRQDTNDYYSYKHLYFVHIDFKNSGEEIIGTLGGTTPMNDIGDYFNAILISTGKN